MRLIDADSMITKLKNTYTKKEHALQVLGISTEVKGIVDCLIDVINDMPTEKATKHAHWTEKYVGGMFLQTCSNCNFSICIANSVIPKMRYCPNCGARMDVEKVFYENEHQKNIGGKAAGKKI